MSDIRVSGIGVGPTVRWSLLGSRLYLNVEAPVDLLVAGTFGVQSLAGLCVMTERGEVCSISGRDYALAAGLGGGMSLRVHDVFHIEANLRRFWSGIERAGDREQWLGGVGVAVRWGESAGR